MNVLIVGFSSLVQRRVLPALVSSPMVKRIFIASRREICADVIPGDKRGGVFRGYREGLERVEPCIAYISLPNSMHADWSFYALEKGFHVAVDKPSVTDVSDARKLVRFADNRNLCFAEANVWYYHPLVRLLKTLIGKERHAPMSAHTIFTSPQLESSNFRYNPDLGSGVLFDRSSYAISCGRILFGGSPVEVFCRLVSTDSATGVDLSFSVMMKYNNGGILQGFFSLDAEYRNSVSVIGSNYILDVDRIFTPPPDYAGFVHVRRKNLSESMPVPAADTFVMFLEDVITSIQKNQFSHFSQILLDDAEVLSALRMSAQGG